jgi:anaerobic magnesium-protoporphyrin IX monomethyl ester cyclase
LKVLLVTPYQDSQPYLMPNLGLGYLATALLEAGHEVEYLDCVKERLKREGFRGFVERSDCQMVGIQMFTYNYRNVLDMFEAIKEVRPDVFTICGGPHINSVGMKTLKNIDALDYACSGEGEQTLVALCNALEAGDGADFTTVPNLLWRDGSEVRQNRRTYEQDLDAAARPAWHLMQPNTYPRLAHGILNRAFPIAPIFATRGCPYPCTFCSAADNMGKKLRVRSSESVVDEIEFLAREYGVREIHIEDDNFTFNREFAMGVCEDLIRRDLGVVWCCPNGVRLDRIDKELLIAMERAGCYSLSAGIETGSNRILDLMKKQATAEENMEQLWLIRDNTDIQITAFIIWAYPGETLDDVRLTEEFIKTAPLDRLAMSLFQPLPNSPAARELIRQGLLPEDPDWSVIMSKDDDVYANFSEVPTQVLIKRFKRTSMRFYFRPRILTAIAREIRSLAQLRVSLEYVLHLAGLRKERYW